MGENMQQFTCTAYQRREGTVGATGSLDLAWHAPIQVVDRIRYHGLPSALCS